SRAAIDAGTATEQRVTASGGGHYLASGVEGQSANLEVSGGSVAEVWVTESLDVEASGGSHVEYLGNPSVDQELSGGGELNRGSRERWRGDPQEPGGRPRRRSRLARLDRCQGEVAGVEDVRRVPTPLQPLHQIACAGPVAPRVQRIAPGGGQLHGGGI